MPTGLTQPYAAAAEDPAASIRGRYLLGLCFILLQCIVWIVAAILTQNVYENSNVRVSPFVLTYAGMSLLALLLPIRFGIHQFSNDHTLSTNPDLNLVRSSSIDTVDRKVEQARHPFDYVDVAVCSTNKLMNDKTTQWNHKKHFMAALLLTPAMFLADWAFNAALVTTTVASATVLVSTQSVFVFGLAVMVRLEAFSWWRLLGVLACVIGTTLTTVDDASEGDNIIAGDAMAVIAAIMYAVYTIQVRVFCPQDEELYSMQLLFGYIGAVCFVSMLPVAVFVFWNNPDTLTPYIFGIIALKGMLDFCITDYCLFRAIILTNATIATVGLGLTIPMAFLADWSLDKSDDVSLYGIIGALAVSIGFVIVNVAPQHNLDEAYITSKEILVKDDDLKSSVENV